MENTSLIIDFDSTFITVETLDELAQISIGDDQDSIQSIEQITSKAMTGEVDFCDALLKRIKILSSTKNHIEQLVKKVALDKISPSFIMNRDFIDKHKKNIYIVSGGFREVITPIVTLFGILEENIFANSFIYENENIVGYCNDEIMSSKAGKVDAVRELLLSGRIIAIGDGYTDYQIKEAGEATDFIAYTESITRENVVAKADSVASSFDEVINYIYL